MIIATESYALSQIVTPGLVVRARRSPLDVLMGAKTPQHDGATASGYERLWANAGGPMSRTRKQAIRSSLLDADEGPIFCPRQVSLGLDFGELDPTDAMEALLNARCLSTPEELRAIIPDIPGPMLCCVDPSVRCLSVKEGDPERVLRHAFLLGLCTAVFFDPARPVLWTRASLTRRLTLFETVGFYA